MWESQEKRERDQRLCLKNHGWKLPKSGEMYGHPGTWSSKISKRIQPKETFTQTHYNQTFKNSQTNENFEGSKRRKTNHIQWNPDKANSKFISIKS